MTDVRWSHNPQNIRSPLLDGVGFQHHALAALPPGRPGTLRKGSLLNVESGMDGQGQSFFPPGFNPPRTSSPWKVV